MGKVFTIKNEDLISKFTFLKRSTVANLQSQHYISGLVKVLISKVVEAN